MLGSWWAHHSVQTDAEGIICVYLLHLWINRRGKQPNTEREPQSFAPLGPTDHDDRCAVFVPVMLGSWWAHHSVHTDAEGIIVFIVSICG